MGYLCCDGLGQFPSFAPRVGVNYGSSPMLPPWAERMLLGYMASAGVDRVYVNSTSRSADSQAAAMFRNEQAGDHINYGAPGRDVITYMKTLLATGSPPEVVVPLMAQRIRELSAAGQLVSYHLEDAVPVGFAAADISPDSVGGVWSPGYNALLSVLEAAKGRGELKEVLRPDSTTAYDPAIHVVFVESDVEKAKTRLENLATGGASSRYEGDVFTRPLGIPWWMWLGGSGVALWLYFKRR